MTDKLWQALGLYLLAVNLAAFVLMGADKRKARRGAWRIWGRAGWRAGDADLSSQDPALVFPLGLPPAPGLAAGRAGLAGLPTSLTAGSAQSLFHPGV